MHKSERSLLLCYVGHHDKAYDWAKRRRLETHPKTGAAQLVEIRETVQEILIPTYVEAPKPATAKLPLFADISDEDLLTYGVPLEWLPDVRQVDEDNLLLLAHRLPGEAAEALLELATGGKPLPLQPVAPAMNPLDHPDAQRRFRVMSNVDELQRALEFPWDRWSVFLHPEQRQLVERHYTGPARVSGSAGTGKTIVALHRAVFLARANQNARVLLTTFSHMLANALRTQSQATHQQRTAPGGATGSSFDQRYRRAPLQVPLRTDQSGAARDRPRIAVGRQRTWREPQVQWEILADRVGAGR